MLKTDIPSFQYPDCEWMKLRELAENNLRILFALLPVFYVCLLYTSDAADE